MARLTVNQRLSARIRAALCAAALAIGGASITADSAQAQDLSAIAPLLKQLATPQERLSDSEIRERSFEAGLDRLLSDGRVTPQSAFGSYRAYRSEQRRLEERNRRIKQQRINAFIDVLGAMMQRR